MAYNEFKEKFERLEKAARCCKDSGGGGGGGGKVIETTYAELVDLINNGNLEFPATYTFIADVPLYGGTRVWFDAVSANGISSQGLGEFSSVSGNQSFQAYQGPYVINGYVDLGYVSNYNIGDKVLWGGKVWENISGNDGSAISIGALSDDDWVIDNSYIVSTELDIVGYNFADDIITFREDSRNNRVEHSSFVLGNARPISWFRWFDNTCHSNKVINGGILNNISDNAPLHGLVVYGTVGAIDIGATTYLGDNTITREVVRVQGGSSMVRFTDGLGATILANLTD